MSDAPKDPEQRGLSEALRTAIERTFAATADSAAETRERAQELLDDVARRGQEAIEGMRPPSREEIRALEKKLEELAERVARLESKSKVEG